MDMELRLWSIERNRAIEADLVQRVAQARAASEWKVSTADVARGRGWLARTIVRLIFRRLAARAEAPATGLEGGASVRRSY